MDTKELLSVVNNCISELMAVKLVLESADNDNISGVCKTTNMTKQSAVSKTTKEQPRAEEVKDIYMEVDNEKRLFITVRDKAKAHGLPTDDDFIRTCLHKFNDYALTLGQLDTTFRNVEKANAKEPKKDIKKYVYGCLQNANKK